MIYAREANSPPAYCNPAAANKLVDSYIWAWSLYQMDSSTDVARKPFMFQEQFISDWRASEYDLMTVTKGQIELINTLISDLVARKFTRPAARGHERRNGPGLESSLQGQYLG